MFFKMNSFLFFPASSITQLDQDHFNIQDIFGGDFLLSKDHIKVYLSQPLSLEEKSLFRENISNYDNLFHSLLDNKIIYKTKLRKYEPFNRERVLGRILNGTYNLPATLNIGEVTLELTQACPYHCEGCFREINDNELTPISRLEEIISELTDMGLIRLSLSGGEITAYEQSVDRFLHIASYAKSKGLKVGLLTTGYNPNKVEEALNYLDEIQISIDGLEKAHDSYKRFAGAFERAVESIKIASKNKNVKLTTNTVVSKLNYKEIPQVIDFLSQFDIDVIRINKIMTPIKSLKLDIREAIELYTMVRKKQWEYPDKEIINAFGPCSDVLNCTGGIVYAHISATGNVFACDYDLTVAGNINYTSFTHIWTNSQVIKEYRKRTPIHSTCLDCNVRVFCFGNCRIDMKYVKEAGTCKYEIR